MMELKETEIDYFVQKLEKYLKTRDAWSGHFFLGVKLIGLR